VTCGRTSGLKRFLSMPRYLGASRKRMKRGKNSGCDPCTEDIERSYTDCGSDRLETSCHPMSIMVREGKKVSQGFDTSCGRYSDRELP
jgi:hypothetical protein